MSSSKSKELHEIIGRFVKEQLGLQPKNIFIDTHHTSITVTLREVLSEAEKNGAKDPKTAELIVKALSESFRSIKEEFIKRFNNVITTKIKNVTFLMDIDTNCATIIIITEN